MEFINNLGHVFSLKSYEDIPYDQKYNEEDYIFWIKEDQISVNNYYILPIKFLVDLDTFKITNEEDFDILIESDSLFFKLIGPKTIQEKIESEANSLYDCIFFKKYNEDSEENDFKKVLTKDDFYYYFDNPELGTSFEDNIIAMYKNKSYIIFPFYIVAYSKIEGTFLSNIMISLSIGNESTSYRVIKKELSKDGFLDQVIKKSLSDIDVYWHGVDGKESPRHICTIKSEYHTILDENNPEYRKYEILYPDIYGKDYKGNDIDIEQEKKRSRTSTRINNIYSSLDIVPDNDESYQRPNHSNRIHNFDIDGCLPTNVYHFIQKVTNELDPELDYLPVGYYSFKGQIYDGCNYCGSRINYNHEGKYSNRQVNNYNDPNFPGDNTIRSGIVSGGGMLDLDETGNVKGSVINTRPQFINTIIKDFYFDIDSYQLVENPEGVTSEEKIYTPETLYTPITVGATFIDECEELIINGKNMGIRLPKEIIKAFYQSSIYNYAANEKILKDKLKELLLNYMSIKGECGNFRSMLNSLKWFGWNDKVEISKLIKTDNQFQNQYILDYFNVDTDIKSTYRFFKDTNLIDLSINENQENGNVYIQDFNRIPVKYDGFIGEGNPELENLFDKVVEVKHEHLSFYKPYYDFNLRELALKLDCLAYYYQTYFLPIHIKINRASIERTVYANHIKMNSFAVSKVTPSSVFISNDDVLVEFPEKHELLYYKTQHFIDNKYNEFSNYNLEFNDEDLYDVNENNIYIPIKIININKRYSKSSTGEYILIGNTYIKPDFFLYQDGNDFKYTTPENATHYRISKYNEITEIDPDKRYKDISSDYFNCNLILTYTYKVNYKELYEEYSKKYNSDIQERIQEDGYKAFAYIDGKYICIEKIVNDIRVVQLFNKFGYNVQIGNYVRYNDNLEYVLDKNLYWIKYGVLINQKFNYYQSIDQYYKNLVLVPRLFDENIDWLKCEFKISMLVNRKWFEYEFTVKTPNLYIQLGKLQYQYYLDDNFTMFKQIKNIDTDNHKIYFNSFMYQPSLVTIDTLFKDDNDNILSLFEKLYTINEESQIRYENQVELDYPSENLQDYKDELVDLKKIYDHKLFGQFYDNYYRGKISIPYNKNFYNRIHLFELYSENDILLLSYLQNNVENISYILFSCYNSIYNILIKDENYFNNDTFEETFSIVILNYDNIITIINQYITMYYDDNNNDNTKIKSIRICFKDKKYKTIYPIYKDNNIYTEDYSQIEYNPNDEEKQYILYTSLFDSNNYEPILKLYKETVEYDAYLMHDKYEEYNIIEINENNLKLSGALQYGSIKTPAVEAQEEIYYTEEDEEVINGEKEIGDIKIPAIEAQEAIYYTKQEVDEYNRGLEGALKPGDLKHPAYWYMVYISRYPISYYFEESLKIHDDSYLEIQSSYKLKYSRNSLDKFLVNRMNIILSNGMNHFNSSDMIIVSILNNNQYFNIDLHNKWQITHINDYNNEIKLNSNTNTMIIHNKNANQMYSPGYYNILLNYTIDGLNNYQYETKVRFRVNKNDENNIYGIPEESDLLNYELYNIQ